MLFFISSSILYAWAHHAEPTSLPQDTSFKIDPEKNGKYLVLQVHYLKPFEGEDHTGIKVTYQSTP